MTAPSRRREEQMEQHHALAQEEAQLLHRVGPSARALSEHYAELRARFPDQYVALHQGEPVASGTSLDDVIRAIREARLDESEVVVEFFPASDSALVV